MNFFFWVKKRFFKAKNDESNNFLFLSSLYMCIEIYRCGDVEAARGIASPEFHHYHPRGL